MAPSKSGKKNSKNWKLNTPLLSKCQKIQNICSYKKNIDHNKAWATSLIRIKGWGRRELV